MKILWSLVMMLGFIPAHSQRKMEFLNRGVVAVRSSASIVFVSWRLLGTETSGTSFNIYFNGTKLNSAPLTGATHYVHATTANGNYLVRAIRNGVEEASGMTAAVWTTPYWQVPLQVPAGGTTPDGVAYTYAANDISVGDLDGDGDYEYIVKWDPSNAKDNSQSGYTGNVYLDAYDHGGTRLWRIDLGRNIRAGAHYTQFLVYDFDSDGRAEVACKTADGSVDGLGVTIGDGTKDYRNSSGYILTGPEFLTVFSGLTGGVIDTKPYTPARGTVSSWGDNYGNRVDRFLAAVAYLDGVHPSMIFGRGYYTRLVRSAWDLVAGKLVQRWIFDSNVAGNGAYAGMGNHQLTVGDANGDGKDEIFNGSSAIGSDGKGFFVNGYGHGDALHLSDMDPDRPGLELWLCLEDASKFAGKGLRMLEASTGKEIWGVAATGDVGRALAADIDPRHKGYECWGATGGLYNSRGDLITTSRPSMNHAVWWDGDLQRELLDGNVLDKWDAASSRSNRLFTLHLTENGAGQSNNGTKKNPCLTADILGDWREEIVLRTSDSRFLNIYTTSIPTTHRFYTLMHDPQYRLAIAWQNSGYNQPPHPGFYLGEGMNPPPVPSIQLINPVATSVRENLLPLTEVQAFPNPTADKFRIRSSGVFRYAMFDASGKIIEEGRARDEVEIGHRLASGVYVVQVHKNNRYRTFRLVKL